MLSFFTQDGMVTFSLVLGFCLLIIPFLDSKSFNARAFCTALILILSVRYMYWRITETVWPAPMPTLEGVWIWFCLFLELLIFLETGLFYFTVLKRVDRTPQADRFESILRKLPPSSLPSVDVYLPTYNEGLDVLERSIIGCLHIDWPKDKLRVYVLDDGSRPWLKEFCESKGAHYVTRADKQHAKAGNLNNAFDVTKGQFIAIFDADFVPFRNFLYRTIGFFTDPKVSIVQTPQHFFNTDSLQSNLHLHDTTFDDQRLFFDVMMPARDAWDAAFWCGSCSVTRRSCMDITGGVPTHSITEDLLTTLVLLRHGYHTRYLNEKLSHGLAPEDLSGLNTQRKRWCRGTLQALRSKDGPLGPGLSLTHRFLFFPIHWLFSPFVRVMTLIVPLVFLWFGLTSLLINHYMELVKYQLPMQTLNFFLVWWIMPRHFVPFLNSSVNILNAIQVIPTIISALINPYKDHFAVTPKGKDHKKEKKIHWLSFNFSVFLLLATVGGIFLNTYTSFKPVTDEGFFPVAAFWSCVNMITLGIIIFLSIEHPRKRQQERFPIHKPCEFITKGGEKLLAHVVDLSITGAQIRIDHYSPTRNIYVHPNDTCILDIRDIVPLNGRVVRLQENKVFIAFSDLTSVQHDDLIRHIFTGNFDNKKIDVSHWAMFKGVVKRAFGRHD